MAYLTGAGHFGFGFLVGTLVALFLMFFLRKKLSVQLYAPFLPFALGVLAAAPYPFYPPEACGFSVIAYLFVFYPLIHCSVLFSSLLASLHLVAVICGFIYILFLWRYIGLVKRVRRRGWRSHGGR